MRYINADELIDEIIFNEENVGIHEHFADDVCCGRKTFEIRNNDRGYQTGDYIKFIAVDTVPINHPINNKLYLITYVLSGWGLKDGYVAFGIKEVKNDS